ncbi:Arm DNA-binding domain-containing protein [Candidatus Entotheonella palauensis]|uniref:Arm DNA-binding domain-containing protein n=1 Tax=Candidatus Entotheonella palauensis TaxID=93172 RepID=UPI000B7E25B6|nr:Arm DNA-binding domain-containing protein [Candidatus Entotheonella palauensis]
MPKLTKRFVESLAPDPERDYIIWDSELKEFAIRVWPSGRKTYFLRYRTQERVKRYKTLGQHGKLTTEQARSQAFQYFSRIQQGDDPVAEQQAFKKPLPLPSSPSVISRNMLASRKSQAAFALTSIICVAMWCRL